MIDSTEQWRAVPGHPNYEVSDLDRVWSHHVGRLLRPSPGAYGYRRVRLDGTDVPVHRVVLTAFVGPCPEGWHGCHGNGDPADDRLVNLRWDTPSGNAYDRGRHAREAHAARVEQNAARRAQARAAYRRTRHP